MDGTLNAIGKAIAKCQETTVVCSHSCKWQHIIEIYALNLNLIEHKILLNVVSIFFFDNKFKFTKKLTQRFVFTGRSVVTLQPVTPQSKDIVALQVQ